MDEIHNKDVNNSCSLSCSMEPMPFKGQGKSETRPLTFGAILSVILAFLFLAQQTIPVAGAIALFLCPIPVILMHMVFRRMKYTILLLIVSAFIISGMTTPLWGLLFLLLFGASSAVMAFAIGWRKTALTVVLLSGLAASISTGAMVMTSYLLLEQADMTAFMAKQEKDFNRFFDEQIVILKDQQRSAEEIHKMEELRDFFLGNLTNFLMMFPSMLILSSVFFAGINYQVAKLVLHRFRITLLPLPSFSNWRLPEGFFWLLVLGFLLSGLHRQEMILLKVAGIIGINLFIVTIAACFVIGLSMTAFLLDSFGLTKGMKITGFLFLFFFLLQLAPVIIMAGLYDQLFDPRRLVKSKDSKESAEETQIGSPTETSNIFEISKIEDEKKVDKQLINENEQTSNNDDKEEYHESHHDS